MRRRDLIQKLEEFYRALESHQKLWKLSLNAKLPSHPIRNQSELREQSRELNRMLGGLRCYLEQSIGSSVMRHQATGMEWDALNAAVGNDVAQMKGPSISTVLNLLDQTIGKLQSENPEEEIQLTGNRQKPEPVVEKEDNVQVEQSEDDAPSADKSRTVMVVHGRDKSLRDSMFLFLRSMDLHPVEWSEAVTATGKASPYIGEILSAAFSMAQAVVVLLTGDDMAYLREGLQSQHDESYELKPNPQARPNVLFEAGMALASHPDNTILVEIGKLRPFSDIAGRHTVRLDNSSEKRQDVALRLETAGCKVDTKGKDWHSEGDFTAPEVNEAHAETASTAQPEGEELSEDDKTVLTFLASAGDQGYTAQLVSARLQSSLERAKFLLEALEKRELVTSALYMGAPSTWHLSQSGREVLDELGML